MNSQKEIGTYDLSKNTCKNPVILLVTALVTLVFQKVDQVAEGL
jgi:hypothetical protein